jgi:hypothetical protein
LATQSSPLCVRFHTREAVSYGGLPLVTHGGSDPCQIHVWESFSKIVVVCIPMLTVLADQKSLEQVEVNAILIHSFIRSTPHNHTGTVFSIPLEANTTYVVHQTTILLQHEEV